MSKDAQSQKSPADGYSIAMVAACPFPANHGSAASIREMSDTLSDMGHNVHIVTYPTGQEDIRVRRAKVHRSAAFRPETNARVGPSPEKFMLDFHLLRLLCRVIRRERVDIIHAHNYEGALIGIAAKWLTQRPLLYNAVNLMTDELAGYRFIRPAWLAHGLARSLDWFIPIFPDHITAVSPELRDWFIEHGVPAAKIDMVPAGIEPELFAHPAPEKFRERYRLAGHPVIMYTGVLNAFQRVDYLLRAFAVALRERPDALLLVVSPLVSEAHEKEHQQLANELGISGSIIWISPHALEDLPSFLALADVCVVPRPECPGHPVKLLNYMLAGKPVVSFAGGAKGVRHLHDALIVPNHDFAALGRGIVTLLNDPALARELGANAKATVLAEFDWRQICRKIERIYDALLGASSAPAQTLNKPVASASAER
ncbi:MAG: glycosyltransferase family 4 protein [Chthoniobacterales bacterium]